MPLFQGSGGAWRCVLGCWESRTADQGVFVFSRVTEHLHQACSPEPQWLLGKEGVRQGEGTAGGSGEALAGHLTWLERFTKGESLKAATKMRFEGLCKAAWHLGRSWGSVPAKGELAALGQGGI